MATSQCLYCQLFFPQQPQQGTKAVLVPGHWGKSLSLKISRRNTQEPAQSPSHLLKSQLTSYSRFAYSKNNSWMCSWAPCSSQQGLTLQSHCGGIFESSFILMMALSCGCSIFHWSPGQTPPFAEPAWFPPLLQGNYSCCAAISAVLHHTAVGAGKENTGAHLCCLNYSFILFLSGLNKECQISPDCLCGSCIQ